MSAPVYLKHDVYLEPLINQWYAWPLLVAPQTLAMMIANHHAKIMESYVRMPGLHAKAVKDPKLLGGPFLDLPGNQSGKVRALLDQTRTEQAHMLEFAAAVKTLDERLASSARGYSLIDLYADIPEPLAGYVELGYDLGNNPSLRFVESLLYRSRFYDPARQRVALALAHEDHRPFALSTPRWPGPDRLHLDIPFADPAIDRLFRMRETPGHLDELGELIPEDAAQRELFLSLFTDTPPSPRGRDRASLGDRVRIKYFGHAAVLIETAGVSIFTDPIVSYVIDDTAVPRFSYQDLPEHIDYVLLSHTHQDHVLFETLLQLRHKIGHIVVPRSSGGALQDPSLRLILENVGFRDVIELDELQALPVPGGTITGLPFFGEHGDLHIRSKLGYHLRLGDRTIACMVDANNIAPDLFRHVRRELGPVDCLFLGMECEGAPLSWLYGPLLTRPLERGMDQSRRFDGSDAARGLAMIDALDARQAYVYAMGLEPWLTFISSLRYTGESRPIVESDRLVAECRARGMQSERLFGCKEILL